MHTHELAIVGCIVAVIVIGVIWTCVNYRIFERPVLWIVLVGYSLTCAMIVTALVVSKNASSQRLVGPLAQCGSLFFVTTEVAKIIAILLPHLLRSIPKHTYAASAAVMISISVLLSFPERSQKAEFICRLTAQSLVLSASAALFFVLAKSNHSASKNFTHLTTPMRVRKLFLYITVVQLISTTAAIVYTAKKLEADLVSILITLVANSLFCLCCLPFVTMWDRLRSDSTQLGAECQTSDPELELGRHLTTISGSSGVEILDKYEVSDDEAAKGYLIIYAMDATSHSLRQFEDRLKAKQSAPPH